MNKVISLGETLIDFKYVNNSFVMNAGGAPANVCACIAKLGGNAMLLTKLSNDFFSKFLLESLEKYNVDLSEVSITNNHKTGLAFIKNDEYNFYFKNSSATNLSCSDIKKSIFKDNDILHFGSICLGYKNSYLATKKAIEYSKGLKSFDVNLRENLWDSKEEMINKVIEFLPYADIIKFTLDELEIITGINDELKAIKKVKDIAPNFKIALVTKGSLGVVAYDNKLNNIFVPSIYVEPVDTTGAGDTFIGSFLYYIQRFNVKLDLESIKKALEFSSRASSFKVSHKGTMEGMPTYYDMFQEPLFFNRNRVFRIYLGGKGYHKLLGDPNSNNNFPEEWICSKVKAINPKYFTKRDGVSIIENTNIYLDDLLKNDSRIEGNRKYDCLVKYLDSAIRLPMQVHPTKDFSRKYFNSEYGKTEAWLVIDARENAKIYFGFKNKITKEELSKLEEKSNIERDIMRGILNEVNPKVGDVFLIKGGLIHAIGENCTIIEVQEPTDFTIQPEAYCGTYKITEEEKYIGLTKDVALDCFNYDLVGDKALEMARMSPKIVSDTNGVIKEALITYSDTPCFSMYRYTIDKSSMPLLDGPSVWIVLDGEGILQGKNYSRKIKKGEYFLLPYDISGKFKVKGNIKLIQCIGSDVCGKRIS